MQTNPEADLDSALADLSQVIPAGQPCDIADMLAEFISAQVDHGSLTLDYRHAIQRAEHKPSKHIARAIKLRKALEIAA